MKVTLSVIKADVGGYVGHSHMHPKLEEVARESLEGAKEDRLILDFSVLHCGDDLELIMTHTKGEEDQEIHKLAWDTFMRCTEAAQNLKLYGAGQDMLADAFSGNVKGMGPGVAEMVIDNRESEPILIFMADKTSPGAWNLPLFKMFADPFNTPGLVIDPKMHDGFVFEVMDVKEGLSIKLGCPEEMYDLLVLIGAPDRYMIKGVYTKEGRVAAKASVQRLNMMAGKYVGKDDPVLIVRTQSGFPAVGEALEPFSFPHLVEGWMRGSHNGPFTPVSFKQANPTRFDGPPRVICAGYQLCKGILVGPVDMFDDPSYDYTRQKAWEITEYMRRHGPFEPHRLPLEEMEYTTMPEVMKKLNKRFTRG